MRPFVTAVLFALALSMCSQASFAQMPALIVAAPETNASPTPAAADGALTALTALPDSTRQVAQSCQVDCEPDPSPFSCSETDGYAPHQAGTLWFFYYGDLIVAYNDYCATSIRLVEYWCNSASTWTTTDFYCTNGCSGGRCL